MTATASMAAEDQHFKVNKDLNVKYLTSLISTAKIWVQ